MKSKNPYLSITIPSYNEEKNLKRGVLDSVYDYLTTQKYSWEILLVDDGSTDNTLSILNKFADKDKRIKILGKPHRGKAGAVIAGILASRGEIILFTDMDQSTPIDQVEKFLPKFKSGFDVVIGSRHGRPGQPIIRKIMAYGWVFLRTLVLRLPFKDTQCGFKAFKKESAKKVFGKMQVFKKNAKTKGASVTAGFDLEMLYIARKLGLKIAEVNVDWYEYGERKEVSPIKDSWEGLRDLVKVRMNAILGKYKV